MDSETEKKQKKKNSAKRKLLSFTRTFSYDCPVSLCQPLVFEQDTIKLHMYIIHQDAISSNIALLSNYELSDIPDIKLLVASRGGDWENNEKLFQIWKSMIDLEKTSKIKNPHTQEMFTQIFNEETVTVIYKEQKTFTKKDIDRYFRFYLKFYGDIYGFTSQSISSKFYSIGEASPEQDVNRRSYLLLPATYDQRIDDIKINEYLRYQPGIYSFETSVATHIEKLKNTPALLENSFKNVIFETTYGNNARYYYVDIIMAPQSQRAIDLIHLVMKYYDRKTYEELLCLFNLTPEDVHELTVDYVLYEHKVENIEFIGPLRKLDAKYNMTTDRSLPLILVQPPLTPMSFDMSNMDKIIHAYPSCRKHKVLINTFSFFPLIPAQFLKFYPLTISLIDEFIRIPSIMVQVERYVMINELRGRLKIVAKTADLAIATSTSSFDSRTNNELLEMLGDSVLKFIASLYNYVKHPTIHEGELSDKRIRFITNEYLLNLGLNHHIPYFIKTIRKNASDWRLPYIKQEEKKIKHLLTGKQIADGVESIIGACFIHKYELKSPLMFLKQLGMPIYGYIMDTHLIRDSCILIPDKFLPQLSETFHENSNYYDLNKYFHLNKIVLNKSLPCGSAVSKAKVMAQKLNWDLSKLNAYIMFSVLTDFEQKILGYRFKNKAYLVQALNQDCNSENPLKKISYESMEFLGDSVLEVYVLCNVYKIMNNLGKNMTPDLLQNMKISLLSNNFMARVAIMNNFHRYMITNSLDVKKEIDDYVKSVRLKAPVRCFVKHEHVTPKVISDIFESLAGAVLYDGGWKGFHQVFGRLLGPYIMYFCLYHHKMETNIVETLLYRALEQYLINFLLTIRNEIVDIITNNLDDGTYETVIRKRGDFICKARANLSKVSKERACHKACKMLGYTGKT